MMRILVVDDEQLIRELIVKYIEKEGYEAIQADNGLKAIEILKQDESINLVVMDIMMPELDGFSAVKEIRTFSNVPVIVLSARSEEYDKLYGFDLGIDDYVTKPFSPKELLMRIKAIINRYHMGEEEKEKRNSVYDFQDLHVDYSAHLVYIENEKVELARKEYELLVLLIQNKGIAVTRDELLNHVWGKDYDGDDRTLDTHMKSLRKKMGKYSDLITTIRSVGYRFDA